ncbi:response regulator [Alkalitalea saponilacus]|uniref:Response regulator receiver domain-containing protein n=1 Tax=Alkalitalea saponilacus TaxID=889453 RepID=A0A1T5HIC0_9BACT|nr:response regulator [Alkalitalea saponilacus]ASB48165.1 response regulator [Alkalitalea saponilacus]SKC20402.1 Response regulator receiver domain-containing protein [Alkalitalea saponilacus]
MTNKIKVLYVDDEHLNVLLFEMNFSKKFDVLTGKNGLEGLNLLNKNPDIKVVISDMRMPKMNGLEFINKARENFSDKKYFILTGFDITPEIREALENRIILKYFMKPFNMREIEGAIYEVV